MSDVRRVRLGSVTGLAGLALLAACAGAQSPSNYQEQQQAAFYAELLQQQALMPQAAQAQTAAQTQAAAQAQTAAAAQAQQQALTAVAAQPVAAPGATSPAVALPAARIDGQPITSAELAAHQGATGLARAEALDDLIDVTLLKSAATRHGLGVPPGPLPAEARSDLERALADKLGLGWSAATPAPTIHAALRAHLLEGKVIEILDLPAAP